ncbi:MAG: hypothetical protein RQ715_03985 [Methylococcales bacterium]|nr:hypothetical protein [Methylococcales bacterium]
MGALGEDVGSVTVHSLKKRVSTLAKYDLLIIDELGYLAFLQG